MSKETTHAPFPTPDPTPFTQGFWDACQREVLEVYACDDCSHLFLPGGPTCPECWSTSLRMQPVSGRGEVFSFVIYRRTYHPAIEAPYVVALITLEEGPRLISNIVGCPFEQVAIGMTVQVRFEAEGDFVLPRFEPHNPTTNLSS